MNNFRSSVVTGKGRRAAGSLLGEKNPRGPKGSGLDAIPVDREEIRTADHRDDDRHRLTSETAEVRFRGKTLTVELINLSGGGAMIGGNLKPKLWERIDLILGENGMVECAVCWIRGDRFGLEFAHETQVHGDPETRNAMLLEVLRRTFPDARLPTAPAPAEPAATGRVTPSDVDATRRGEQRHPLIWSGAVHYNHDSTQVRLRNISPSGSLIDSPHPFPTNAELYLDLGEAGSLFATAIWSRGDQVGLRFAEPFDIADLAKARPDLAPHRWNQPDYLREHQSESSPWAKEWGRASVDELKTTLEGYLKH